MRVTSLSIQGFRNIAEALVEPGDGVNVIYGDNAQGKTNLLEALWMFCGMRSFRGSRESELIAFGGERARLHLEFFSEGRDQTAEIAFGGEKRRVLLNEIPQERLSLLTGEFLAVVFSPDQLSMVKQGPEGRRRFLDTSLTQVLPKYRRILESYERILRQRAHLLRDCARHPELLETLGVWDGHLVQYGSYIMATRAKFTARMEGFAKEIYRGIASGREELSLSYRCAGTGKDAPEDRGACEKLLTRLLQERREEDLKMGATTAGPHRDDLSIQVDGRSARSYASQGQQRSCVLALKLAECDLLAAGSGEQPVVLLDDVMSELDEGRRNYLLNHLSGRQVLITCCDAGAFGGLGEGRVFHLEAGRVRRES